MFKKTKKVHTPKNDNIDSINICRYLKDNKEDFKSYTLTSYHSGVLKSLSRDRFSVIEEHRQAKLAVYRILVQLFSKYLRFLTIFISNQH